jgi:hypothetical protein
MGLVTKADHPGLQDLALNERLDIPGPSANNKRLIDWKTIREQFRGPGSLHVD